MTRQLILTAGAFGTAVGAHLSRLGPYEARELPRYIAALDNLVAGARFVGVAAWRPYLPAFLRIDTLCYAQGFRASYAVLQGERLTAGPLVVPGASGGACYHCYLKRWNTHHPAPERELVLQDAYDRDFDLGPPGFLQPMVTIAASALHADSIAEPEKAGQFRAVDILTGSVMQSSVLAVHRCPRCRGDRPHGEPGSRFVDHLVPTVARLLA